MFSMLGTFAEFERSLLQERVRAGLARARAQGKTLRRPKVRPAIEAKVRRLRGKGMGMIKISKQLGIGVGTVQRIANGSFSRV